VSKHQLQRSPIRFKGRADPSHIYLNSDIALLEGAAPALKNEINTRLSAWMKAVRGKGSAIEKTAANRCA
jgi:hypothetical protein